MTAHNLRECIPKYRARSSTGPTGEQELRTVEFFSDIVNPEVSMPELRIGISGWRYGPWRRVFYPPGLAQRRELEFASRQFNSIEINGSFYSLLDLSSWERWYSETPEAFVFSVKGSRFITHMKKLNSVENPLANFFS